MGGNGKNKRILLRVIGDEADIYQLLRDLEGLYNIRLFPDTPEPDRRYGGTRVYVRIPEGVLDIDC
jgi:hypothetical protein